MTYRYNLQSYNYWIQYVGSSTCGYAGINGYDYYVTVYFIKGSMNEFALNKLAYEVEFACSPPQSSEYYIMIGGVASSFTLDVTNSPPNCSNNCSGNGACLNNGIHVLVLKNSS